MYRVAILAMAVLLAVPAQAQTTPTFHSLTELVLVPVKVTKSKKHLPGLAQSQFHVFEDGVERKIASFEEVLLASSAPAKPPANTADTFSNQPVAERPGHVTIFLLDALNAEPFYFDNARRDLVRYLEKHAAEGPFMVTVLTSEGLQVVQNYSADPQIVLRALQSLKPRPKVREITPAELFGGLPRPQPAIAQISEEQMMGEAPVGESIISGGSPAANVHSEFLAFHNAHHKAAMLDLTLAALTQLANSLAAVPGRKTLIWAGNGIPDLLSDFQAGWRFNVPQRLQQTWAALNLANLAVYPVRVVPGSNPAFIPPSYRIPGVTGLGGMYAPRSDMGVVQDMMAFAEKTGGKVCTFRTNLGDCFRQAMQDSADYYLLAYYTSGERRPGWHKIRVTVSVPGTSVRARQGYMQPGAMADSELTQRIQFNTALASPLDFTTLPLSIRWSPQASTGANVTARFNLMLRAQALTLIEAEANHFKFDVVVLAFDNSTGKRAGKIAQTIELHPTPENLEKMLRGGLRYSNFLELPAGQYTVRVLVRDALSGKLGSLTVPLKLS